MFSTQRGGPALLNDRPIHVSERGKISEEFIAIVLFKSPKTINYGKRNFARFSANARKVRIMGAAALDIAYVACGRFDAYIEYGIKIWDIAAGLLILENAGGSYRLAPTEFPHSFECITTNGKILRDYRLLSKRRG
jgi:myo-inositol-1(or 4)-monophosphatase